MFKEYKNATVETAINTIKQKHWTMLDAEDIAFLQARKDYLSEADVAIYLEGKNPDEVNADSVPLTREERIIRENRPLQELEMEIREAKDVAAINARIAEMPLQGKERTDRQEQKAEERAEKLESLNKEAKAIKVSATEPAEEVEDTKKGKNK